MTRFSIELPDEEARRLRERAGEAGLTPEEFLDAGIKRWLDSPNSDFVEAADYVLRKNADLYKRLA
ncbi:MAG TPA: hypothetical protein VNH11_34865 [Pirellulales bacterium]|nr:hypothetical protein [Pirellulales bacterium]